MDLVSRLPDELLCHVLSFLPTKNSASTSVLSKRWLNLWKLVPNLDFDDFVFLHLGREEVIRQSFTDFVDKVLTMQGDSSSSPIKSFSLKCISGIHPDTVNRWISNVLRRGVSELHLSTDFSVMDPDDYLYSLPRELFFSTTLVTLKLRCKSCVTWCHRAMGYSLPLLKSLCIDSDLVFGGEFEKFVASFPVLEELRVSTMCWRDSDVAVSSANLTRLSLRGRGTEVLGNSENPKSFSFDTPNLLYLDYSDLVAEDYPVVNMGKLLEARINLRVTDEWMANDVLLEAHEVLRFANVVKLMNGLQNVLRLTLSSHTLEVLAKCCDTMPVFNNLKFLSVTSFRGWQAMPAILRNCPRLETIIIQGLLHYVTDECGDACPCVSSKDRGRSLASCPVNRLEIRGFGATMKEMDMIKHFLEYFPCLKRVDVFIDPIHLLRNNKVSVLTVETIEMFELYSKLWPSCNVKLFVGLETECTRAHLKKKTQTKTKTFTCFHYFCFVLFLLFLWCYYLLACNLRRNAQGLI